MKVIDNDHPIPFDVDDTLVMWHSPFMTEETSLVINGQRIKPHEGNIKRLKEMKAKGQFVIVWSAAGYEWAATVLSHLELTQYVDLVMTKPRVYFDDLNSDVWMTRLYEHE